MYIEMLHNTSSGGEFITKNQIEDLLKNHKFLVISDFLRGTSSEYGNDEVAEVLYKGNDDKEAKRIWKNKLSINNWFFSSEGCWASEDRRWFDTEDIKTEYNSKATLYPVGWFEYDETLGEKVYTKELKETKEDIWYLVRVCDIDFLKSSYIGQVILKTSSKQEAYDKWNKYTNNTENNRYLFIFNPAKE